MVLIEQTENSLEQIQLSIPGDGKIIYECMWSAYPAMLKNAFSTIKAIKLLQRHFNTWNCAAVNGACSATRSAHCCAPLFHGMQ